MAGRITRFEMWRAGRGALPIVDVLPTDQLKNELIRRGFEVTKAIGDAAVPASVEGPPVIHDPLLQPESD